MRVLGNEFRAINFHISRIDSTLGDLSEYVKKIPKLFVDLEI